MNKKKLEKRICKKCGRLFPPKHHNSKLCSVTCKAKNQIDLTIKYRNKNRKKINKIEREKYQKLVSDEPQMRYFINDRTKEARNKKIDKYRKQRRGYERKNKDKINAKRREWWKKRGKNLKDSKKEGKVIKQLKRGRPSIDK